jgi:hypothetical protein
LLFCIKKTYAVLVDRAEENAKMEFFCLVSFSLFKSSYRSLPHKAIFNGDHVSLQNSTRKYDETRKNLKKENHWRVDGALAIACG